MRMRLIAAALAFTAVLGFSCHRVTRPAGREFAPVVFNSGVPNSEITANLTVDNPQAAGFLTPTLRQWCTQSLDKQCQLPSRSNHFDRCHREVGLVKQRVRHLERAN